MSNVTLNNEKSWKQAREYGTQIGTMPAVFAAAVRLLMSDHQQHDRELRPVTKFLVGQALRGKKILSMLYYATCIFKPQELESKDSITLGELINLYQPYDLAVLYGLFLIHRRAIKVLKVDRMQANLLTPYLRRESQLGGFVGCAIGSIGLGNGLLAGTGHHLAMAMFAAKNPADVHEYYEYLKRSGKLWDLYRETELFGCTSLQTAAVLLTNVGFGKANVETYLGALDPGLKLGDPTTGPLYPIKYGRLWVEGLIAKREQPVEVMPGKYYPLTEAREWMNAQARMIGDESISWIERDGKDLSTELTPLLFKDNAADREVPEQLRDIFSLREIAQMGEEEFDDLVDQIDRSIEDGEV